MDIAQLLESHKQHFLALVTSETKASGDPISDMELKATSWVYDRATTRTLLDLYRKENTAGTAALTQPPPVAVEPPARSRVIKPGSKRARDRAQKAQQTRQRNIAAKQPAAAVPTTINNNAPASTEPVLSPATHLAPVAIRNAGGDGAA